MRGMGKADVFVMLAHPVGHAKSPGIFNRIFEAKGVDSLMVPLSCRHEDFDAFRDGLTAAENIRGIIVSVPFTQRVFEQCAAAHDRTARVHSANPVRRQADGSWYADNLDGMGFMDRLKAAGHEVRGKGILQGGAGASLAYFLAEAGAAEIRLCDVDRDRAANRTFYLLMKGGVLGLPCVGEEQWGGLALTLFIFVSTCLIGFPLAIDRALLRRSKLPVISRGIRLFIDAVRSLPLLSILFAFALVVPFMLPGLLQGASYTARSAGRRCSARPTRRKSSAAACKACRAARTRPRCRWASATGTGWAGSFCRRPCATRCPRRSTSS